MIPPGMITDPSAPTTRVRPVLAGMGVRLYGSSSGYAGLKPAAAAGSTEWELPSADGSSGQYLQTNGSGVLSWASVSVPTFLATGTDRSVQVRNGTGNSYTDSLLTVAGTTGVAGLTGTTPMLRMGVTGTGLQLSMTTGANPQLDVRNFDDTIYGRVRAHTYYFWDGSFLYTDGTAFSLYKSNGSTYSPFYTGNQRIYDTSLNTNYLALSHNGTDANAVPSAGSFNVDVASGSFLKVRRSDATTRFTTINPDFGGAGTQINSWGRLDLEAQNGSSKLVLRGSRVVFNDAANTEPVSLIGTSNLLTVYDGGGTAIRDLKARTFYGMAQAATDTPGCDKGALAQSANLREWQDSLGNVLSTVSENGYLTTRKNSAPADAELAAGEAAYWFDSTNGAAKFMIKAKQADGTVVTGSVALA